MTSEIGHTINAKLHEAVQDVMTHAAFTLDTTGSNEEFIALLERLLHYIAFAMVSGNSDEHIRTAVEIAHERLDEIVAKVAADARAKRRMR